jgi:anti-sigma factor RsiW
MTRDLSHAGANELLPWYANGTLSADERAGVERHLGACAICRQELESLRVIGTAMNHAEELPPARVSSLGRTMAAIDEWETTRAAEGPVWKRWFAAVWTPSVPVARFALAAQFALILALGAFLVVGRPSSFTTLSGPGGAASGVRLTVAFEPEVTEATLRKVLLDSGGRIVSGPSALGIYVVELTGKTEDDPEVDLTIDRLRNTAGIIRFVELEP